MPQGTGPDRSPGSLRTIQNGKKSRLHSVGLRRAGRRGSKFLWPIIFGLTVAFVIGGLVFLWPMLKMAGFGLALLMVVAVLISSLTPLLLLRRAMGNSLEEKADEEKSM